jgi:hypothetical protein
MQLHNMHITMELSYTDGMPGTPRYVSANLTPEAAGALRDLTATMTIASGRRVTTSDLVNALVNLGKEQQDELLARIQEAD